MSSKTRYPTPFPIRVIGLGNSLRGDDAAGLLVARRLKEVVGLEADVIEAELAGLEVLDLMKGQQVVFVVDGARAGGRAGGVLRLDVSRDPLPRNVFPHSSHAVNALDAIDLARSLGVLPPTVIVYGIELGHTSAGSGLSAAVAGAVETVAAAIAQEIERIGHA